MDVTYAWLDEIRAAADPRSSSDTDFGSDTDLEKRSDTIFGSDTDLEKMPDTIFGYGFRIVKFHYCNYGTKIGIFFINALNRGLRCR